MKKILIIFLSLALSLSFCGSSLVFADEEEDSLGSALVGLTGDAGEPPAVSVEITNNPDQTTNSESQQIAGDVNGDVSIVIDGNGDGSQNTATLEIGGDVDGKLEITDGAQTKGIFDTTDGNGEASESTVSVDIGGDVENVKIYAGESEQDATSTVNVNVGGDVVAEEGNGVSIYGSLRRGLCGENRYIVKMTMHDTRRCKTRKRM